MKKTGFFLLIAVAFGVFTCDKDHDTIINGVVTDAKTGAVIAGVELNWGLYKNGSNVGVFSTRSDSKGNFQITFDKSFGLSGFLASKAGYLSRPNLWGEGVSITEGTTNDVNLILHPLDGNVRLVFINTSLEIKVIYAQGQTPTTRKVLGNYRTILTVPYPREVPPNTTIVADYPFPADEMVYLFWDVKNFDSLTPEIAAFSDSLYLAKSDTSVFEIHL